MIKTINRLVIFAVLMMFAVPSYSAQATQMWKCGLEDDASEEEVEELLRKWLTAAKQMDGGANMELSVLFPVAVNNAGETDFYIVVDSPSFVDWGKFWDGYRDSPAAAAEEEANSKFVCPDSFLWESIRLQ